MSKHVDDKLKAALMQFKIADKNVRKAAREYLKAEKQLEKMQNWKARIVD